MSETNTQDIKPQKCGIIMPISAIGDCSEKHWAEVREIISDVIECAGFEPNLVSDADDIGIIQKRIIQNIYQNPIVVCDVSAKNPNVMFELGMRLAFDKPTVIIKDDKTEYSFDTSPIEHISYPRDLRFSQIVEFKEELELKIKGTVKAAKEEGYTTFLKHFGTFHVAELESKEVTGDQLIIDELQELRTSIKELKISNRHAKRSHQGSNTDVIEIIASAIKKYATENSIRGKTKMRDRIDEVEKYVMREIRPGRYFSEPYEYRTFFKSVFNTIYG